MDSSKRSLVNGRTKITKTVDRNDNNIEKGEPSSAVLPTVEGVHNDSTMPKKMGIRSPDNEDESEVMGNSSKLLTSPHKMPYTFWEDSHSLFTSYSSTNGPEKPYLRGILTAEYRVVERINSIPASNSTGNSDVLSTVKTIGYCFSYQWKNKENGPIRKGWLVVDYDCRLEKTAYEKPMHKKIGNGILNISCFGSKETWKYFISLKIDSLEAAIDDDPSLIRFQFAHIGLQKGFKCQEAETYVWNESQAHIYCMDEKKFKLVNTDTTGYCPIMTQKGLTTVIFPSELSATNIMDRLLIALEDTDFMTLLCLIGQVLLSLKPHLARTHLRRGISTTVLVGKPGTYKTTIAQYAAAVAGKDVMEGRAYNCNHMSAFMFGMRCANHTLPAIISDPPIDDAKNYASSISNCYDDATKDTFALKYTPGGSFILCINNDFMDTWQGSKYWDRLRGRLVVISMDEIMKFPNDVEIYPDMQELSSRLGHLLLVDIDKLKEHVKEYEDILNSQLRAILGADTLLQRMRDSLSMFLALGEHVGNTLIPTFKFRDSSEGYIKKVLLESLSKYQKSTIHSGNGTTKLFPAKLDEFVQKLMEYALSDVDIDWSTNALWQVIAEDHECLSIRPKAPFLEMNEKNKPFGKVGNRSQYRVLKPDGSIGQKTMNSYVIRHEKLEKTTQNHLKILDYVARHGDYKNNWLRLVRKCFKSAGKGTSDVMDVQRVKSLVMVAEQEIADNPTESCDESGDENDVHGMDTLPGQFPAVSFSDAIDGLPGTNSVSTLDESIPSISGVLGQMDSNAIVVEPSQSTNGFVKPKRAAEHMQPKAVKKYAKKMVTAPTRIPATDKPPATCSTCFEPLERPEKYISWLPCSQCEHSFHEECTVVPSHCLKGRKNEVSSLWKCPGCVGLTTD